MQIPSLTNRILLLILLSFVMLAPQKVSAASVTQTQQGTANNKFGIHLAVASREDEKAAAALVNSSGGDWGYITFVIQDNDRNTQKWQETFDSLRRLRLIPIIRIATHPDGASWKRPVAEDADEWVAFFESLHWVVKDRYIILFNEPNHAAEWGGSVDAANYANVAYAYAKALRAKRPDYVVMLAGLDAAAPQQPPKYMDEYEFLKETFATAPQLAELIGAISSHSYPNPGFSASPQASGRTSIRGYEWELEVFRQLGVTRDLPVYITETGWSRDQLSPATVAQYFEQAFTIWNADSRVEAVTPFLLNYQGPPFLPFSWQQPDTSEFYPQYHTVAAMEKTPGRPQQLQKGSIHGLFPKNIFVDSTYSFRISLENQGQAVWDRDDGYEMQFFQGTDAPKGKHFFDDIVDIEPKSTDEVTLFMRTGTQEGEQKWNVSLTRDNRPIISRDWNVNLLPLPKLRVNVALFPRIRSKQERNFEVQLFDENEQLVFKQKNLKREGGAVNIERVKNVYVGGRYRVVILSRQYLPRQSYLTITPDDGVVSMRPMLPLDFNEDGHFSLYDIWELITHPWYLGYFLP